MAFSRHSYAKKSRLLGTQSDARGMEFRQDGAKEEMRSGLFPGREEVLSERPRGEEHGLKGHRSAGEGEPKSARIQAPTVYASSVAPAKEQRERASGKRQISPQQ
ncbi:UNVERIFIED_CONTAM: hypothetical protein HHA_452660 [Hammondia hammondi]|eukprot:XP_008885845.1 hypothetical protein HHA_452660 [Hammondia hammondi]